MTITVCLLLSAFAKTIVILYLTVGLGTGLGFGLIYLPAMYSVTSSFDKFRSRATGIAATGPSLGNFSMAPILTYLLKNFCWQKTLMIYGLLVLCCSAFGVFFKAINKNNNLELPDRLRKDHKCKKISTKTQNYFRLMKNPVFVIFAIANFLVR